MSEATALHPQEAGFTPRYTWRGRERHITWRCCGQDAHQGKRDVVSYREIEGTRCKVIGSTYFCQCLKCGRTIRGGDSHE